MLAISNKKLSLKAIRLSESVEHYLLLIYHYIYRVLMMASVHISEREQEDYKNFSSTDFTFNEAIPIFKMRQIDSGQLHFNIT